MNEQLARKEKIIGLMLATLFMAVSLAQFAYVQSTFLNQFFSIEFIGFVFFVSYVITFFAMNWYSNLIAKLDNLKTSILAIFAHTLSIFIFIYFVESYWIILGTILYVISTNLIAVNFDIFLEAYTSNSKTGKFRGIYYTIYNLGWLISPLATGLILEKLGFNSLFGLIIASSIIYLIILCISFHRFHIKYLPRKFHFKKTYGAVKANSNIKKVFVIAFLLQIFYAAMVVYAPLYLNQTMGLTWTQIGIIFTFMLLPFVLVQYPAGYLADKFWGEKEMMTAGLIIMIISSIAIFFIESNSLILWAIILFISRIGASLTEIMRDTYFFKKVNVENIDLINAFRSTTPLAYIFVPICASLILYYLPFNYLFLILGLFLSSGLTFALTIKDTK